jgi:hypothetical protein
VQKKYISVPVLAWCAIPAGQLLCPENPKVHSSMPPVPHSNLASVSLPCSELLFQLLNLLESVYNKGIRNNGLLVG